MSAQLGGNELPLAAFQGATLHMTETTYEFAGDKGKYAVVSSLRVMRVDIHGVEGPNAGRTIEAIYDLDGDELTVCYQLGDGARPEGFVSPPGTQVFLVHYERVR